MSGGALKQAKDISRTGLWSSVPRPALPPRGPKPVLVVPVDPHVIDAIFLWEGRRGIRITRPQPADREIQQQIERRPVKNPLGSRGQRVRRARVVNFPVEQPVDPVFFP